MAPVLHTPSAAGLRSVAVRSGIVLRSAVAAAGPLLARRAAEHLQQRGAAEAAAAAAGYHHLAARGLTVSNTQKVTLGVIAAYIVAIALLWNIPYVRTVLWPFKVSLCIPSLFRLLSRA